MHGKRVLHRILATRREALAVGVLAAIRGGRLTVTDLGRSIPNRHARDAGAMAARSGHRAQHWGYQPNTCLTDWAP